MARLEKLDRAPATAAACRRAKDPAQRDLSQGPPSFQRVAVLQAAAWLLDIAEMMTPLL